MCYRPNWIMPVDSLGVSLDTSLMAFVSIRHTTQLQDDAAAPMIENRPPGRISNQLCVVRVIQVESHVHASRITDSRIEIEDIRASVYVCVDMAGLRHEPCQAQSHTRDSGTWLTVIVLVTCTRSVVSAARSDEPQLTQHDIKKRLPKKPLPRVACTCQPHTPYSISAIRILVV